MATLLVTSVGAIGSANYGWLSIRNALTYGLAQGFNSTFFGRPYVTPDIPARMLALDLTEYRFGLNFSFGWEGQLLVAKGESLQHFGYPFVATDQYTSPVGPNATLYGRSFVSSYLPYLFEFSEARPNEVNNLHLPLSGGVIFLPKGQDSLELGYAHVATVQHCFTEGWDAFETFKSWVLPFPYLVTFDLLAYPRPEVRFTFSGADIVNVSLSIGSLRFGLATVATDQLVGTEGFEATLYGKELFNNRSKLELEFVRSNYYTGANVPFAWGGHRAFSPTGWDSLTPFNFVVGGNLGYVAPFGWRSVNVGSFSIRLEDLSITLRWLEDTRYGVTTIFNADDIIHFLPTEPQTQWAETPFVIEYLPDIDVVFSETNAKDFLILGVPSLTLFYQGVSIYEPHPGGYIGSPKIIHQSRTVDVSWMRTLSLGNFSVIRHYDVQVESIPYYSKFGIPGLDFGNVALPKGLIHSTVSNPTIWFYVRRVYPSALAQEPEYGPTLIYNSRQIVEFDDVEGHYDTVTHLGEASWIYNRNRVVDVAGLLAHQSFPLPAIIWNKARAVLCSSSDFVAWGVETFIADRVRYLPSNGWESCRISRWNTTVHNAASAIRILTFNKELFGLPLIWKNQQTIKQHTGAITEWGTPFISYAIRGIQILRWPEPPITVGQHQISNKERFVGVIGEDYLKISPPIFTGPFRRGFTPRWQVLTVCNAPARVWNFNPQVWIPGRPYTEWSYPLAWVSHSPRTLLPETFGNTAIGRHWVHDKTQAIYGKGIWVWVCERYTRVRNQDPDPPSTQIISFTFLGPTGDTIRYSPDTLVVPHELTVESYAVVIEGYEATLYGDTFVRTNVIYVQEYYQKLDIGSFQVVKTRYVLHIQEKESSEYGKPRISPYTVWAWHNPPQQATDNLPGERFRDFVPIIQDNASGLFPWFGGGTSIASTLRTVTVKYPPDSLQVPKSFEVVLKHRYLEMIAIRPPAVSQPKLTPHTKHLRVSGFSTWEGSKEFNVVKIDRYPKLISGGLLLKTGTPRIELWNREIKPQGIYECSWGDNFPMIYHYPRAFSPEWEVEGEFGLLYIDYKNRKLPTTGFSATQWDYTEFRDRMTIYGGRYDLSKANNLRVFPIGWSSMELRQNGTPPSERSVRMYTVGQGCVSRRLEVINGST